LSCWDLPNENPPSHLTLGTIGKPLWVGVHWDGLVMFRPMVQELLNIEHFFKRKFNIIKVNFLRKLGQPFGIVKKPLVGGNFLKLISWCFRPKMKEILNFQSFLLLEIHLFKIVFSQVGSMDKVLFTLEAVTYSCSHLGQWHSPTLVNPKMWAWVSATFWIFSFYSTYGLKSTLEKKFRLGLDICRSCSS